MQKRKRKKNTNYRTSCRSAGPGLRRPAPAAALPSRRSASRAQRRNEEVRPSRDSNPQHGREREKEMSTHAAETGRRVRVRAGSGSVFTVFVFTVFVRVETDARDSWRRALPRHAATSFRTADGEFKSSCCH